MSADVFFVCGGMVLGFAIAVAAYFVGRNISRREDTPDV